MYPTRDLNTLITVKTALRRRIAHRRQDCARQADRVLRPLHWIDRTYAQWRRLAPLAFFAAGPVGLWLTKTLGRRHKLAGRLIRWAPVIWRVIQGFTRPRPGHSPS